jgi:hypothetical protein
MGQKSANTVLFAGRRYNNDGRKFIALQQGIHTPSEHGLAAKGQELLRRCPTQTSAGTGRNDHSPRAPTQKRLLIVHS